MTLTQTERDRIIAEVSKYTGRPRLEPDEFTTAQYAERQGLTSKEARTFLNLQVEDGVLTKRIVVHNSHRCYAYRLAEPEPE